MDIIFFGSTDYSVKILEKLVLIGRAPVLVVTQPDKPKGRKLKKLPTPVKEFSQDKGLEVVTPLQLGEKSFSCLLKSKKPDIFLVAAFGKIIPSCILDIPLILPLGVHPSLLPQYRGAAPINWALIKGERLTGVSLYKIDKNTDTGPVFVEKEVSISEDDDFISLQDKLSCLSQDLVKEAMPKIEQGDFSLVVQDSRKASYAPKINKEIVRIDWSKKAVDIKNLVRGVVSYQTAWSLFRDKRIKFWQVSVENDTLKSTADNGQIIFVDKRTLKVQSGSGIINIKKIQPAGKKVMRVEDFINGYCPEIGEKFF